MRTYARIQDGIVAELLKTASDITKMFSPSLVWVDVTSQTQIKEGWHFDGKEFAPPPAASVSTQAPTLSELQAQVSALQTKLAALANTNEPVNSPAPSIA
jgi:hypothetical protein